MQGVAVVVAQMFFERNCLIVVIASAAGHLASHLDDTRVHRGKLQVSLRYLRANQAGGAQICERRTRRVRLAFIHGDRMFPIQINNRSARVDPQAAVVARHCERPLGDKEHIAAERLQQHTVVQKIPFALGQFPRHEKSPVGEPTREAALVRIGPSRSVEGTERNAAPAKFDWRHAAFHLDVHHQGLGLLDLPNAAEMNFGAKSRGEIVARAKASGVSRRDARQQEKDSRSHGQNQQQNGRCD